MTELDFAKLTHFVRILHVGKLYYAKREISFEIEYRILSEKKPMESTFFLAI